MSYTTFDLETTIKLHLKRKASPFYGVNRIVAVGMKDKGDTYARGYYLPEKAYDSWFLDMLNRSTLLVGFNIKFDILHAICADPINRAAWVKWIADGGKVWDCQLAEYLLHGQAQDVQIISMDEVAPRYGGNLKNDAVKALWQAGVDTIDIDRDLLMEYLVGTEDRTDLEEHLRVKGDIGNTETIFLQQVKALRARGGIQSAMLNMGALTFTIEAEYNGMYVDKERGLIMAAELAQELVAIEERLQSYIPADLPFTFKWTSRFHLSALVFGGSVSYTAKEPILTEAGEQTYAQKEELHAVMSDGTTMEVQALNAAMASGETMVLPVFYASGKNKGELKTKKVKVDNLDKPKFRNVDREYRFAGYTKPSEKWASSTPGVYSVSADVIAELGNRDIPFLQDLALRSALAKDLGTYYITTDEDGDSKGMLTLVGPDGIIHHQLHMNRTITARLSSSDPNLQNVSGGAKSQVKTLFISRFTGGYIVQSDFTALEVYVQAVLTGCRQLILDLRAGLDMHCVRVSQKIGEPYEEVLLKAKDENHPEHSKYHKLRKGAKEFSFQRAYGAGVKAIAASTGMSEEDVQALVDAEMERYPEIEKFYEGLTEKIKENRVPTSRFCQHPEVKGLQCQLGRSYYITPDGKMYSYSESPSPKFLAERPASRGGTAQSFSPTEIKNYVVQGTGGEWAKAAMWLAVRAFAKQDNFGGRALLVNQVHDAVYIDAAPEVYVEAAALLHACMLEASNLMEHHFKWAIPVGVPSETKAGSSMMEEKSLPDPFNERMTYWQAWVRETFIANNKPTYEG